MRDFEAMAQTTNQQASISKYVVDYQDPFLQLWPHRYDYLWAPHPNPGEKPQWQTESRHPLSDRLIQQGSHLYGVRFGAMMCCDNTISATAELDANGGNIFFNFSLQTSPILGRGRIDSPGSLTVNNDVIAIAENGYGGNIYINDLEDLTTGRLYQGFVPGDRITPSSNIIGIISFSGLSRVNEPGIEAIRQVTQLQVSNSPYSDICTNRNSYCSFDAFLNTSRSASNAQSVGTISEFINSGSSPDLETEDEELESEPGEVSDSIEEFSTEVLE